MKFKDYFFWLEVPERVIWKPFWSLFLSAIVLLVPVINVWWWLIIPIFLVYHLQTYYLWWISWDFEYKKQKWVMLELIPPKEVLAPFSAMDDVFNVVWSIIDSANWRETWCEGELPICPYWCSWEIASIEGKVHFYVRCLAQHRNIIESVLYSHYPEVEIVETSDYTKNVPQDIPNEEWQIYAEDYILGRGNAYPIKTYSKFFEPQGEKISQEEKRIDPIASLLENLATLDPGEQFWLQIIINPAVDHEIPWKEEAKKIINKIAKRPEEKKESFWDMLGNMFNELFAGITGSAGVDDKGKAKSLSPAKSESTEREMIITPGEREILSGVEEKIKKAAYKTNIRAVYIAKKGSFKGPNGKIARTYFMHFAAANLNYIRFSLDTRTKIHYILRKTRERLRAKKIFRNYIKRYPYKFPVLFGEGNPILNTEELATIFHFPTKISGISSSAVAGVEAKRGGPPANLPFEE
ncbi:hypothetical protein KJ786_03195 [Patescibacteria group bacterium]|nr:hypothetical protein [Patescibacteria group bacterium]